MRSSSSSGYKQYKLLLESIPRWAIVAIFLIFVLVFSVLGVLVGFFAPAPYTTMERNVQFQPDRVAQDFYEAMAGIDPTEIRLNSVDRFHSEILFYMKLFPSASLSAMTGMTQTLQYEIKIYGAEDPTAAAATPLPSFNQEPPAHIFTKLSHRNVSRTLSCPQGAESCSPIYVFHEPFVLYRTYAIYLKVYNQGQQVMKSLYKEQITFGFTFVQPEFTYFELIYRYAFLFISILFLIGFTLVTLLKQPLRFWHTEQRWIMLLLCVLILFNNPFYILHFVVNNFIFQFANVMFRITYIAVFLYSLLVFTHTMFTKPQDRDFITFYLPKVAMVGSLWLFLLIVFIYANITNLYDPSYAFAADFSYYKYIQSITMTLVCIYLFWLLYYTIRAWTMMHELPDKYSSKFKMVWLLTLGTVVTSIVVYIALHAFGKSTSALSFVAFHVLFNVYSYLLAFLFLPSNIPVTLTSQDFEEEGLTSESNLVLDD